MTLSDADRLSWIQALARVGAAQHMLTTAQNQLTAATTAQATEWTNLKAAYPGLVDGSEIDAATGLVTLPSP